MSSLPATGFATVTVTAADVDVFPAASAADAWSVWVPLLTDVVSHENANGPVASWPIEVPSTRSWVSATPTLSVALTVTVVIPPTVAPAAGVAIETAGRTVSAGWLHRSI